MTRLTELHGALAGNTPTGATVRWDRQSLDVLSVMQTARTRRAEYIAENATKGLRIVSRWLGLTGFLTSLRRRHQRRRTLQQLSALDDRMLSDIGVHRADIDATATLCCEETPAQTNSVWYGLGTWVTRELHRRRTQRELAAMSDELLADIGIDRSDIPAIAAALAKAPSDAPSRSTETSPVAGGETTATGETLVAQVIAFTQVRQSMRRAVNQNRSQSSAA